VYDTNLSLDLAAPRANKSRAKECQMTRWIFCLAYTALYHVGLAQGLNEAAMSARLEQVASSYTAKDAFMGTALVAEGDRILLNKGYGMANLERGIPNSPDAKFRICSLTKQFTATLILKLQEQGKLNIDDPVWSTRRIPDGRILRQPRL
jgi:CubicO group peptidase (beta-lactamase class C family)